MGCVGSEIYGGPVSELEPHADWKILDRYLVLQTSNGRKEISELIRVYQFRLQAMDPFFNPVCTD